MIYMMQSTKKTGEMESVFELSNGDRLTYLRNLMHSFGSSYICLWTYSPHLNILYCEDGHFQVETSSSSGVSLLQTLFNQYKQSVITLENRAVPGLAFRDKNPCLQLQESVLQSLAKGKSQRQFYLEAKIKTAIFLGCEKGEIELGIPEVRNNVSSGGSGCHPFLLQNICLPSPESTDAALTKAYLEILSSPAAPPCSASTSSPSQSTTSAFTSYHHRSPSPTTTSHHRHRLRQTLFKRAIGFYRGIHLRRIQELAALHGGPTRPTSNQLHHMISERRRREKINDSFQALRSLLPQPTKKDKASVLRTTKEYLSSLKIQVSELNKRNQLLETKLISTTTRSKSHPLHCHLQQADEDETITVKLIPVPVPVANDDDDETIAMPIVEEELQVIFRRQTCSLPDLVIRLLEFLKQVKEVSVMSMEAQTEQTASVAHDHQQTASPVAHDDHQQTASPVAHDQLPTNFITLRLRIMQGVEWDESAFIEAVRRLVADFT